MNVVVDFAEPRDDAGIRRLVETQAMPGRVRVSFCREPDFSIGCAVTGEEFRIFVARVEADEEVVGVACRSVRRVFLNGREERIGYLGQLRVHERCRGRWLVSRGFARLEALHRADPLPAYLASIVDGNQDATGVLVDKPRRAFPLFREAARYVTFAVRVRRPGRQHRTCEEIVHGSADHVEELSNFLQAEGRRRQLSSVWTVGALRQLEAYGLVLEDFRIARRDGQIVGTIALWDQSAYKQSVIRGYSGWLRPIAPILPRPGTKLRSAYAALIAIANDDTAVFRMLLEEIHNLAAVRRFEYLLLGLDTRDPLISAVRRYRHIAYPSRLYLASWSNNGGSRHEQLDARPVYVDIATL
jgi:hypothetical protein